MEEVDAFVGAAGSENSFVGFVWRRDSQTANGARMGGEEEGVGICGLFQLLVCRVGLDNVARECRGEAVKYSFI